MAEELSTAQVLAQAASLQPAAAAPTRSLLREEVYAQIRTWIVEGLLPPGMQLRDKELAETLRVSRTPVREALRRLQDEELVVAEASRWTKVAPVDTEQANRVYPIIWTLERLAVSLADGWDADRLTALRAANDRVAAALASRNAQAASEADAEFHGLLTDAARNRELSAILRELRVQLRRLEIAYFGGTVTAERSVQEHERIVAALEAGNVDMAGLEIERNWRVSLEWIHARQANDG